MTNTLANPIINNSQITKLARLTEETKVAKAKAEQKDKELKEYRERLPISQGETTIGKFKVQKTWVDGRESFDLKSFREAHKKGEQGPVTRTIMQMVESFVKRGKGYYNYTVTTIEKKEG